MLSGATAGFVADFATTSVLLGVLGITAGLTLPALAVFAVGAAVGIAVGNLTTARVNEMNAAAGFNNKPNEEGAANNVTGGEGNAASPSDQPGNSPGQVGDPSNNAPGQIGEPADTAPGQPGDQSNSNPGQIGDGSGVSSASTAQEFINENSPDRASARSVTAMALAVFLMKPSNSSMAMRRDCPETAAPRDRKFRRRVRPP